MLNLQFDCLGLSLDSASPTSVLCLNDGVPWASVFLLSAGQKYTYNYKFKALIFDGIF